MILRRLALFAALAFAITATSVSAQDYKGAIVIDAATGQSVFEDNPDFVSPPASVTKLMTFLIVHDALAAGRLTLQTPVTIDAVDASMGGTQVLLAAGETFTVEELLFAVMVESANDAAHALTHAAAANRAEFVALMNARAQSLGMKNTVFRSPHGLPPSSRNLADGDLTTPRDLALLSRELVTKTDVLRYSSVRTRPFAPGLRTETLHMLNHNKLLGKVAGVDGLKTGFTRGAGFCLAATAQRGNQRVIVVAMGGETSKGRDLRVAKLIEDAFPLLPPSSVFKGYTPPPASPISAENASPIVAAPAAPGATIPPPADDAPMIKFTLPPRK
jgi:D-alanyl-D-alanine carboxypeptidase (penicillin-binding protein 5/6)